MINNIKLLDFDLELYDNNNINHTKLLDELWLSDGTKKYLYDKEEFINNIISGTGKYNCIYLVMLDSNYIGFVSLYYCDNTYEICDGIINKYRNKGYSTKILKEFSKYIFSNTNITELYGYIDENNIASIKSAINSGFVHKNGKEYILKNEL